MNNFMKNFLLLLCIITQVSVSLAQQQKPLSAEFECGGCHPTQVIFKLKSEKKIESQTQFAKALYPLPQQKIELLSEKEPSLLFPKDSYLFKDRKAVNMGNREKQLALIYTLELKQGIDLVEAINLLRQDSAVAYAEPVYINYSPLIIPNDPLMATNQQYHLTKIKAFQAWDIETGNPNVFIGITDNGFNISVPDLSDNVRFPVVIDSPNDLNNDLSGADFTVFGDADADVSGASHGQAVALCSSAVPDNGVGSAGTGYHCKFLPIKVAADNNLGFYTEGYQGILYAAKQGSAVINMSWGRKGLPSAFEQDVIYTAYEYTPEGIVLVAAAGNDNTTEFFYPATYDKVLSIAASNASDFKAGFSTYNQRVDLIAPGEGIKVDNTAGGSSGTSFASPLVAGAVALLRSKFPDLTADQVIVRIKTTTDNIYQLPENQVYIDQLGTGRLNMQRMLDDPLKAITLESFSFSAEQRGFLFRDTNSDFICNFSNHLEAVSNLSVSLYTESPFVEIITNEIIIGAVSANTNFEGVFSIRLLPNTPANTIVKFEIAYQDGAYSYTEKIKILMNPGHLNINETLFSVADNGKLAINSQNYDELSGFSYDYPSQLTEAGLMIATREDQISDAVRNVFGVINQDFTTQEHFSPTQYQESAYLETKAIYEDFSNNSNRIGVEITQKTYSWNEATLSKGHVIEYNIRNLNSTRIDSLYASIFANWNVYQTINNRAGWVDSQNLGFARNSFSGSAFMGIQVITPHQGVNYYAFDNVSAINVNDGFSDAEKFQAMSGGIQNTTAGTTGNGADIAHSIGVKIKSLNPGPGKKVAFVFAAGDNLAELQANAQALADKYISLNTSPLPELSSFSVCSNQSTTLRPNNGTVFRFYNGNPSEEGTLLISTGSSLTINDLQSPQTFYITCIDEVFESPSIAVNISISSHETNFEMSNTSLDLSESDVITLTSTSVNASNWSWQIRREGEIADASINFINGTNAQSATPQISFIELGEYEIKLISQNTEGCIDSLIKSLTVFESVITTRLEEFEEALVKVYPNPIQEKLWIEITNLNEKIRAEIIDSQGQQVYKTEWVNQPDIAQILQLSKLNAGVYFLRIIRENGRHITRKIAKY
jgi:hypothetical protein